MQGEGVASGVGKANLCLLLIKKKIISRAGHARDGISSDNVRNRILVVFFISDYGSAKWTLMILTTCVCMYGSVKKKLVLNLLNSAFDLWL